MPSLEKWWFIYDTEVYIFLLHLPQQALEHCDPNHDHKGRGRKAHACELNPILWQGVAAFEEEIHEAGIKGRYQHHGDN